MVVGRYGSGPKLTSDRQMASDILIAKLSPVSGFRRHESDIRKNLEHFVRLNS